MGAHWCSLNVIVMSWVLTESWQLPACTAQGACLSHTITDRSETSRILSHALTCYHLPLRSVWQAISPSLEPLTCYHSLSLTGMHSFTHTRVRGGSCDARRGDAKATRDPRTHDAKTQDAGHLTHTRTPPHFMGSLYAPLHVCV